MRKAPSNDEAFLHTTASKAWYRLLEARCPDQSKPERAVSKPDAKAERERLSYMGLKVNRQ